MRIGGYDAHIPSGGTGRDFFFSVIQPDATGNARVVKSRHLLRYPSG